MPFSKIIALDRTAPSSPESANCQAWDVILAPASSKLLSNDFTSTARSVLVSPVFKSSPLTVDILLNWTSEIESRLPSVRPLQLKLRESEALSETVVMRQINFFHSSPA